MSENRLSNLIKDLSKAKQQALLIEVLQSDLESLSGQNDDALKTVCNASAKVFDVGIKSGKTNVLMVGEAQGQAPLSIFGALLNSLDEEFDDLHKREILKKLAGFGLGQALGGGVGDAVSESLSVGAEKMMDYLAEWTGSASDFIGSAFEKGVETAAEQSGDLLETAGETGAEAVAGYFSSDNEMYLSRPARKRLKELAPRLSEQAFSHQSLQLALEMLLVTAQGAPKVIVVKDPTQLDDASLALLAMLVSVEKDLRQLNYNEEADEGKAQTAGITVVLTFTGRQPHDEGEDKVTEKKLRAISRLRMMASRYSLLERLDSDIPVPAVRASTFVGREVELRSIWQDWNRVSKGLDGEGMQTWALIKGEPGTGKTALANRFIQQVRSDTGNPGRLSIPILRMLNQTGHSAQATGLASLKNSVVDELRRLNLIYEENVGWFDRTGQKLKEGAETLANDARSDDPEAKKRVRAKLGRVIFKLLGVDSAIEVARSAKSWREQDEMSSLRQDEFGRSSKANQKDEQYELMRMALKEVSQMAHKCLTDADDQLAEKTRPMILLIDDLQWMDDFTAEFLVNEWPANLPVYVIATARGSDSFAAVTESHVHQGSNRYRNALFAELGVIDAATLNADEHLKTPLSLAGHLNLKGMDQPMLANLILLTYRNITAEQAEPFAAAVIRNLAGEGGASDIITLFAIETLNVISDPQFYRRNPELPQLIELECTDRYRFKAPESINLTQALDTLFKKLTVTYEASYLIHGEQGTSGARFNLASYAILEERLHLIERHFGEHGGAARYSLLFSALLGSPFESGLVRHVLNDLHQLSPQEHPEMAPFLKELQAKAQGSLEPAQYEILERAYEIIRRLEENTGKYAHQHSLLRQFLLGQFTQLVDAVWPTLDVLEKGIEQLIRHVRTCGENWFDNELRQEHLATDERDKLKIDRQRFLVALTGYWSQLMSMRSARFGAWNKDYATDVLNLSILFGEMGSLLSAIASVEEALTISREGFESQKESWTGLYIKILSSLSDFYFRVGRFDDALSSLEIALGVCRDSYGRDSSRWARDYVSILNEMSFILCGLQRPEEAHTFCELAESIARRRSEDHFESWATDLASSLDNLSTIDELLGYGNEGLARAEEALRIRKKFYELDPESRSTTYLIGLVNLAVVKHNTLASNESVLNLYEDARSICSRLAISGEYRLKKLYAVILLRLAASYDSIGRTEEGRVLENEALELCREAFMAAPEAWIDQYSDCLRAALKNQSGNRASETLVREELVTVYQKGFEIEPTAWAFLYKTEVDALAFRLAAEGALREALQVREDLCTSIKTAYQNGRLQPKVYLFEAFNSLGETYHLKGRLEDAALLFDEALAFGKTGLELDSAVWLKSYAIGLRNLRRAADEIGSMSDKLAVYEAIYYRAMMETCRSGWMSEPENWFDVYLRSLIDLAEALEDAGNVGQSLLVWCEAKSLVNNQDSLFIEKRLGHLAEATIMCARQLRMLKRYPEAFAELDANQSLLTKMDQADHPERHYFRAWSLIVRATTSIEVWDLASSKALFPEAEALIRDHSLEKLSDALDSLRSHIESVDHLGG